MTNKQKLVENLYEMSTLSADQFKSRAYNNAARTISAMEENEYNERKSFLDIKGIGTSINSKILEFRQSEQMPCLDKLREEQKTFLDNTLYKVRKNFITKRIPIHMANEIVKQLYTDVCYTPFLVVGSVRRNKPLIADIDLMCAPDAYLLVCKYLSENPHYKMLVSGDKKSSFLLDNAEKTEIDVNLVSEESWAFGLLHHTGSKEFNVKCRQIAKEKGLTLNQYGLFDKSGNSVFKSPKNLSEADILQYLGIGYVYPKNR